VRVFSDAQADRMARDVNARAFTVGQDMFFRNNEYNPESMQGRHLLAHELTHTIQQRGTQPGENLRISQPDDVGEHEADTAAHHVLAGRSVQVAASRGSAIQRKNGSITIPEVTIEGNVPQQVANTTIAGDATPGAYTREIEQSKNRLADKADANATKYALQVEKAFKDFELYAAPKLTDMSITEDDVAEFIVGKSIEVIAGQITGGLTGGIGAKIGTFIVEKLKEKLIASAKLDKVGSLQAVIKQMGQTGSDGATVIQGAVKEKIFPLVGTIRTKCSSNQEFTPAEKEFIDDFTYIEDPAAFDAAIAKLGIPNTTDAVKLQLDIFQALVERFEAKYILANASFGKKISYGAAAIVGDDSHSLDKDAKAAAQQARQARANSMQSNK
jgi:Zn-dependent peptidase ImmA (M78 family)